ncbi:MAG: hypothetical protein ABF491_10160 [Acetobacter sp.]|uniref:hypothetical protein n=1 Tax=Acetobacter sp. TaxID=440 RepID=UPI0039E75BED
MTTITTDISWSGSWSKLYADISDPNTPTVYSDAESSSISTAAISDDGDTVVLSEEAQQAINFDGGTGNGGLDAVGAIFTAAAAVINSSSSSDQEKIAAFGAAFTLSIWSDFQTVGPAQSNPSSYGGQFETLESGFFQAIAGSSFMKTALDTLQQYGDNVPDNASDLQKAIYDVYYNGAGVMYGTTGLSINLQETTTQAADGTTATNYSFSYSQTEEVQAGTQDFSSLVDPMGAFAGAAAAKPHEGRMASYGAASVLAVSTAKTVSFRNPQVMLEQEIADDLFGSSGSKDKTATSMSANKTHTTPIDTRNDGADDGNYWVN